MANTSNVTTDYSLFEEWSQDFSITPYRTLRPCETAYSLVAINIEDILDNYPVLEKAMYTVWVKENQTINESFFSVIFLSSTVLALITILFHILQILGNHPIINHGHDNPELEVNDNEKQTDLAYTCNRFTTTFKIN